MQGNPDKSTDGGHGSQRFRVPARMGEQKHVHIGAHAAAKIGEKEVEPIQGAERAFFVRNDCRPRQMIQGFDA